MVDELTSCARFRAGADGVEMNRLAGWPAVEAARRPNMENDMSGKEPKVRLFQTTTRGCADWKSRKSEL